MIGPEPIKQNQAGLQATVYWVDVEAAYRAVDGLARYYRGQPIAADADATLPQWLVTRANLPSQRPLPAVSDYVSSSTHCGGPDDRHGPVTRPVIG